MGWLKKHGTMLLLSLIFLIGVGLIAYPTFSDWWNSFHQSRAISSYMETVANLDPEKYDQIINDALAYNQELSQSGIHWQQLTDEERARYNSLLSVDDTGIMGYITIPKIDVMLPVYHGVEESILQVAIGHLEGTSLPVGGPGSHCVISGHRGLPSARLFTDLDKLVEGDTFTMTVLDRTLTYEIDQIRTVVPTDLSNLNIESGEDYLTLMTCTPYGINTHRLLVRGHRIANANGDAEVIADAIQIEPAYIAPFIAGPVLILLMIGVFVSTGFRKKRKQQAKEALRGNSGKKAEEEKEKKKEKKEKKKSRKPKILRNNKGKD